MIGSANMRHCLLVIELLFQRAPTNEFITSDCILCSHLSLLIQVWEWLYELELKDLACEWVSPALPTWLPSSDATISPHINSNDLPTSYKASIHNKPMEQAVKKLLCGMPCTFHRFFEQTSKCSPSESNHPHPPTRSIELASLVTR
jgi:hypothetical protein